jgi:hypothetical protein
VEGLFVAFSPFVWIFFIRPQSLPRHGTTHSTTTYSFAKSAHTITIIRLTIIAYQ